MPENFTDGKSVLVEVIVWWCLATSHYLNQSWLRPIGLHRSAVMSERYNLIFWWATEQLHIFYFLLSYTTYREVTWDCYSVIKYLCYQSNINRAFKSHMRWASPMNHETSKPQWKCFEQIKCLQLHDVLNIKRITNMICTLLYFNLDLSFQTNFTDITWTFPVK